MARRLAPLAHGLGSTTLLALGAGAIAFGITAAVDPPLVEESVVSIEVGFAASFGLAMLLAVAIPILSTAWRESSGVDDRGLHNESPPIFIGMTVAIVVTALVANKIHEKVKDIPPGSDIGGPPIGSTGVLLVFVVILAVYGLTIVIRRWAAQE